MACLQRFAALTVVLVAVLIADVCTSRVVARDQETSDSVDSFDPPGLAWSPRIILRVPASPPWQPMQPRQTPAVLQQFGLAPALQLDAFRPFRSRTTLEGIPPWLSVGGDVDALEGLLESLRERAKTTHSILDFPEPLLAKFKNPHFLYTGGFGEAWSAEQDGKPVVVKVLHDELKQHMTWRVALSHSEKEEKVWDAMRECDNSKDMRHPGWLAVLVSKRGAEHIMDCHETNIRRAKIRGNLDEPLYLVLEHCGHENLKQFQERHMKAGTWTPRLVMNIYVQLLEALAYLGRHPNKWLHHDVKPENIVITTMPDGEVQVYLVDMGSACKGFKENQQTITSATAPYYPNEWDPNPNGQNFAVCDDGDGDEAQSFDNWSLTSVLIELVTGFAPLATLLKRSANQNVFNMLELAIEDTATFVDELPVAKGFAETASRFKADKFYSRVLAKAVDCLRDKPSSRRTAQEMLSFIYSQETLFANGSGMDS